MLKKGKPPIINCACDACDAFVFPECGFVAAAAVSVGGCVTNLAGGGSAVRGLDWPGSRHSIPPPP